MQIQVNSDFFLVLKYNLTTPKGKLVHFPYTMYTNMDKSNIIESHTYCNLSIGTEGTEISYCLEFIGSCRLCSDLYTRFYSQVLTLAPIILSIVPIIPKDSLIHSYGNRAGFGLLNRWGCITRDTHWTMGKGVGKGLGTIWRTMYVGFTDSLPHFELLKFVHKIE